MDAAAPNVTERPMRSSPSVLASSGSAVRAEGGVPTAPRQSEDSASPHAANCTLEYDEMLKMGIKTECDVEDSAIIQVLDMSHSHILESSVAGSSLLVKEEGDFTLKTENEMDEIIVKQELDIEPIFIQPKITLHPSPQSDQNNFAKYTILIEVAVSDKKSSERERVKFTKQAHSVRGGTCGIEWRSSRAPAHPRAVNDQTCGFRDLDQEDDLEPGGGLEHWNLSQTVEGEIQLNKDNFELRKKKKICAIVTPQEIILRRHLRQIVCWPYYKTPSTMFNLKTGRKVVNKTERDIMSDWDRDIHIDNIMESSLIISVTDSDDELSDNSDVSDSAMSLDE
ncbi:hypothetical protein EVAR_83149_1 [Eumeta japonica]|uniref:Uncharacterized protein n=1 Tax=Eumeta variegata TaxID=151549 RepID=A0A4C1YDC1_EUMVA|nr:hypothetical protein EVAR_83149_1 [Eumeta japonica]